MLLRWLAALLPWLALSRSEDNAVLCRSCGRAVADPTYLHTRLLSPEFIERRNRTKLFGVEHPVSVEKLKNPAGVEFEVVSFEKAGKYKTVFFFLSSTLFPICL